MLRNYWYLARFLLMKIIINTYYIGYLYNDHKVKLLYICFTKPAQTKWMYFLIENDDLKDNNAWDKVRADIKKESDSESEYF